MTDHAKCRVCGSIGVGLGPRVVWIQCKSYGCGVQGPLRDTEEEAWAAWDDLMRPAIPAPLRELVRAAKAWQYSGADDYEEALDKVIDAIPDDLLTACLKETDGDPDDTPYVCPGCYAVAGEPCAPGCVDAELEAERERARHESDYEDEETDDADC